MGKYITIGLCLNYCVGITFPFVKLLTHLVYIIPDDYNINNIFSRNFCGPNILFVCYTMRKVIWLRVILMALCIYGVTAVIQLLTSSNMAMM